MNLVEPYRRQLAALRGEWGGEYDLPDEAFYLFGMGARRKLIYKGGALRDALSGEVLRSVGGQSGGDRPAGIRGGCGDRRGGDRYDLRR